MTKPVRRSPLFSGALQAEGAILSVSAAWRILAAVFSAGIASLLLELSFLREFVYVIGSTTFSNALIISTFLAGLAAGTYAGAWQRLRSSNETSARLKFALVQFSVILFIAGFYISKDYFIYISMNHPLIVIYFIAAAFAPAFLSGVAYATSVELLFHYGQKYVTYIYASSTLGKRCRRPRARLPFRGFLGRAIGICCRDRLLGAGADFGLSVSSIDLLQIVPALDHRTFHRRSNGGREPGNL